MIRIFVGTKEFLILKSFKERKKKVQFFSWCGIGPEFSVIYESRDT